MTTALFTIFLLLATVFILSRVLDRKQDRDDAEAQRRLRAKRIMEARPHGWRY